MTLAQAIRAGSLLHRQGTGWMAEDVEFDTEDGCTKDTFTCALGAAYEGFFHVLPWRRYDDDALDRLREAFPVLKTKAAYPGAVFSAFIGLPEGMGIHPTLEDVIVALNDEDGWTREQIADWVEGLGY